MASGFSGTGAIEDEGQFLQSVYPIAANYGGPGRFGFADEMHLTENSPLITEANQRRVVAEWSTHWDCDRDVLIEKSPPNLLKTRFLQAMFPKARFIIVLRHPIANALATKKWSGTSLISLIHHWVVCNELMLTDMKHLEQVTVTRYEDLVASGDRELVRLQRFIGLTPCTYGPKLDPAINAAYFARWGRMRRSPLRSLYREMITRRFETRVSRFGYSLRRPERLNDGDAFIRHVTDSRLA
jgi:hypothetical protein